MPSKARLLAKSMIESPILSEITTNPTVTPTTITTAVNDVATGNFATVDLLPSTGNDVGDQAFVQATNRLYIWSGSGWYNIALINTTPTWDSNGQPAATYELSADSPQTATTITLAASDPEGFPITYSHVTGGSMDSIATINQDSSVFTITPKTSVQAPDGGTGTITFRATDGVNILPQVSSFTLNFITTIQNSKYTTLLATATGTSDNNNITDASTNNHSITVNGDTQAGTFSPYRSGGYAVEFDGSSKLTTTTGNLSVSSPFAFGTGNYTIEAWVKPSGTFSEPYASIIYINRGVAGLFNLYMRNDGKIVFYNQPDNNNYFETSSVGAPNNVWSHISLVRSGTGTDQTKLYVNGILKHTFTDSYNYSSSGELGIGTRPALADNPFNGEISDVRVIKGSGIQPPSGGPISKLEAVTNTSFTGLFTPYLNTDFTVTGSPKVIPNSPYDYDEYSAIDYGGSVYFDGSGDVYTLTLGTPLGTSNFTIEAWVYPTLISASWKGVLSTKLANASSYWALGYKDNKAYFYNGVTTLYGSTNGVKNNTWIHLAIIKSGSSLKLFENGINTATTTTSANLSATSFFIGGHNTSWGEDMTGFVSDAKITLSDSVYTFNSDFTPPTEPISSANSLLHIKGTDASIVDKSQGSNLKLVGNTTGSTTQAKFSNTKSMYFDGSGDYIDATQNWIQLRTSDFTVETWFYPTATPSNHEGIFCYGAHGSGNYLQLLYQTNRLIRYDIYADVGGGSTSNLSTTAVSLNTWNHIALCRSGGNIRLYVNGTQEHTEANSSDLNFTQATTGYETIAVIGNRTGLSGYELNSAYLQDLRVTKGLARYTASDETSNIPSAPLEG